MFIFPNLAYNQKFLKFFLHIYFKFLNYLNTFC